MLKWVGINLYIDNSRMLIKFDQLKMLTAINPIFFLKALHFFPPLAEYQPEEINEVEFYNDFEEF